jgi:uncharacterized iron-regulated protein
MKSLIISIAVMLMLINITASGRNYEIYDAKTGESISLQKFADRSEKFDVMFFGEFHDDSLLHSIQADYLAEMLKRNPKTAVSFEMFERDVQDVINQYLADEIDEKEFLKRSRPWPDYLKFYKPLLELAKEHNVPVIAANIPRKYAALYARKGMTGIDRLPENERKFITKDMVIEDNEYLRRFYKTMMMNMGVDTNQQLTPNQENTLYLYYGAQLIKDETMAESISDFLDNNPGWKVIHFNGDFHSNNYLGTVAKLKRRKPDLKIGIITPDYKRKGKPFKFTANYIGKTDFLIQLPPFERPQREFAMMGGHLGENYIVKHDITVELFTDKHSLKGFDIVTFKNPVLRSASMTLIKDLTVKNVQSEDGDLEYKITTNAEDNNYNDIIINAKNDELRTFKIEYEGKVYNSPKQLNLNERHSNSRGIISAKDGEGIYLPGSSYYPTTESDMADFSIKITVPSNISIVTSGKIDTLIESNGKKIYHYLSELKADNFTLVGGKYTIKDTIHEKVKFSTYTFNQTKTAETYLKASIEYYDLYTKLLGPYPYSNFSIVENFFATGFGMPAYTLLSNRLMSMPWILLTPGSLAHEFVHNWWGNSVFTSYKKGNWCEALTTFSANYYYNVLTGNDQGALDWRKKALIAIEALPDEANYPVADFKYQVTRDDAVIGYQKGAFIFYEIMKLMGKDSFFEALRTFAQKYKGRRASWFSLRYVFNMQAKKDSINFNISKIMRQWLTTKEIPKLTLDYLSFDGDSLRFNINQFGTSLTAVVPVEITTDKGTDKVYYTITKEKNRFSYKPKGELKSMRIDKNYEVLRHLYKWEIPYSFNQVLNQKPLIILPSNKSSDYKTAHQLAEMMKQSYGCDYVNSDNIADSVWQNRSIVVLGNQKSNTFFAKLNGKYPENVSVNGNSITIENKQYETKDNLLLLNMAHPTNENEFATVILSDKFDDIKPFRRLFHYLSYSMVLLNKNRRGRPLKTLEIFPVGGNMKEVYHKFSKMYR